MKIVQFKDGTFGVRKRPARRNGRWEVQIVPERARFFEPYRPKETP